MDHLYQPGKSPDGAIETFYMYPLESPNNRVRTHSEVGDTSQHHDIVDSDLGRQQDHVPHSKTHRELKQEEGGQGKVEGGKLSGRGCIEGHATSTDTA